MLASGQGQGTGVAEGSLHAPSCTSSADARVLGKGSRAPNSKHPRWAHTRALHLLFVKEAPVHRLPVCSGPSWGHLCSCALHRATACPACAC